MFITLDPGHPAISNLPKHYVTVVGTITTIATNLLPLPSPPNLGLMKHQIIDYRVCG
jgi:hypothetical protein